MPATRPDDPLDWRPQMPRTKMRPSEIADPILEPHWSGRRVLAHFDYERRAPDGSPWLRLIDLDGIDATMAEPAVTADLAAAILCIDAVVDGFLTDQATRSGLGSSIATNVKAPHFGLLMGRTAELETTSPTGHDGGGRVAFVAVDLLRVDGQILLDVPLLERKRVLDGLIRQTDLVRVTPFTRPPLRPWVLSWKSQGFEGAVLKAANSRYVPSTVSEEWTVVTKLSAT